MQALVSPNPPTLLEQAQEFRRKFPEKWRHNEMERRARHNVLLGIYEISPFMQSHIKKAKSRKDERKRFWEEERRKPRTLKVEVQCCPYNKSSGLNDKHLKIQKKEGGGGGESTHRNGKGPKSGGLVINLKVCGGEYLNNQLKEGDDPCEKCVVHAAILPDMKASFWSMKTGFREIDVFGRASWDHTFRFVNYSPAELKEKYFRLVITGHTRSCKVPIGLAFVAGESALIESKEHHPREPNKKEMEGLKMALDHLDTSVTVEMKIVVEGLNEIRKDFLRDYYEKTVGGQEAEENDSGVPGLLIQPATPTRQRSHTFDPQTGGHRRRPVKKKKSDLTSSSLTHFKTSAAET